METNSQAELDSLQPEHITNDGEINTWVEMEQPNSRMAQVAETELEKMRLDMELTMLKYQYEEKEKQRQHKEKMEQMRLQSPSGYVSTAQVSKQPAGNVLTIRGYISEEDAID
ncbi:hypothetical protein KIL84_016324 [Mauremys mutica]|uniref:Uncharacterized protein n=1 Tax=Mauremys mutica TaxID=74926 RepID=A0A9D4AXN2_9SAUR|nr:hypothetical protein KIL84_016324 [Mauremys mutica]